MPPYPDQNEPVTKLRPLSAWWFSVLLHLSVIGLLAAAVQFWPRGGAGNGGDSISIVFNSPADSATPDNYQGSGGDSGLQAMPEPPALLATPTIAATPVTQQRRVDPYSVNVQLVAAPPAANNNNGQSQVRAQLGSGSGTGGGNGYTKTSVFGVEGRGNKFVYLFDRSASMEGPPLSAAKRQLLESLKSLDNVHQFQIIFFNSGTQRFHTSDGDRRFVFATDRNKQLAANFVNGITADRGTDRMVALREALTLTSDVIFFLTDADDPMDKSELAELARLNRRTQTAICVIEFGDKPGPPADNFLMQLARDSGGRYGYVDTTTLSKPAVVVR